MATPRQGNKKATKRYAFLREFSCSIFRSIRNSSVSKKCLEPWIVKFGVKLYPPIVSDLIDELTRFYIYQQLRDDIGKEIPVTNNL